MNEREGREKKEKSLNIRGYRNEFQKLESRSSITAEKYMRSLVISLLSRPFPFIFRFSYSNNTLKMDKLPEEILLRIFMLLVDNVEQLITVGQVSKHFHR
jgi:hypothetical protein